MQLPTKPDEQADDRAERVPEERHEANAGRIETLVVPGSRKLNRLSTP